MNQSLLDIYSDYLICSFGSTTATGLSDLLNGAISHDKITPFLSEKDFTSADLWHLVKPLVRQVQNENAVLVIDDSIEEKPYTDESALICWHWDHTGGRSVKGVNFLTCLYRTKTVALPVAYQLIQKSQETIDKKTGKTKRVCPKTKNAYLREMVALCLKNQLPFRYVLADSWFSSTENMRHLKEKLEVDFIFALKANRNVALSAEDKKAGTFINIVSVVPEANTVQKIWLEGVPFPLMMPLAVAVCAMQASLYKQG